MKELDIRLDEQIKLGTALLKFFDKDNTDLSFLAALRKILEDMAKGRIDTSKKRISQDS